jgi:tetratricopeptide (TPR) repeat protein
MYRHQCQKGQVSVRLLCIVALLSCGCGRESNLPTAASNPPPPENPAILEPSQLRKEGLAALEAKEVDKADELARAAIAVSPNDPENIFLLAIVLAEQNRFAEAIKRLENLAAEVPSTRLPVLGQTAAWMVEQGRWLDAEQRCIEILDERPDAIPVHRLLVQLYTRQGRRLDAAKHLRYLCRLGNIEEPELQALVRTFYSFSYDVNEQEYEPISELGIAHYQISAGDWDAAATTLNQLPDRNAAESALRGRILIQQQHLNLLRQWATDVPDSAKVTADYWFAMGVHKAKQGDHVSAIKNFCAAVVRDYTDHQAYLWMSRSLEAINADAQAIEAANRAQLIQRTQEIANELAATPERDLQQMSELVDLLYQLQRPFEALSWRAVLLAYGSSRVTELQAQQMITEINEARLQLLQSNEPIPSRQFLLCGITPEILQSAAGASAANNTAE